MGNFAEKKPNNSANQAGFKSPSCHSQLPTARSEPSLIHQEAQVHRVPVYGTCTRSDACRTARSPRRS
jgi:hypothetical protein